MKKNINEALERMRFLNEFTYKEHTRADSVEENPVKFNEIGDKYKSKPDSDYPDFASYIDEVILDEADPEEENPEQQPQQQGQPQTTQPTPEAQPQQQAPVDQSVPPQPDMQQPQATMPVQPEVAPPVEPAPTMQQPTDLGNGVNAELDARLSSQMAKTEELLLKISDIDQKLSSVENVSAQINHVAKEVESIKNPSLDDQLELISKNSYPYNIKLNDYWKWDDEDDKKDKPEEFSAKPSELNSFNNDDIRKSFNVN